MNWLIDPQNNLSIQHFMPFDLDACVMIARRAFDSDQVANEVHQMLLICCQNGSVTIHLEHQAQTLLPVSYYTLCKSDSTGKTILGLTGLYRPLWAGKGVYWLGWFAVDPQYQGRGYGKFLLHASLQLARAKGGRLLCVETSNTLDSAVGLYQKMGFCLCGEIHHYWAMDNNLIILSRSLDDITIPEELTFYD